MEGQSGERNGERTGASTMYLLAYAMIPFKKGDKS